MNNIQEELSPSKVQEMVKPFGTQQLLVLCDEDKKQKPI